ncbi:hypothetical protein JZK55_06760 [Dissulfurispira thermophila]|uniref:Uncharacterized protein n=1 Tax=Dissulfurispira thermophila TaxID=2715679 RepID=A0A7G1GZE8_9BACT|nr:hypothetical protein [Dissulfurispira thermophila]BCB95754.1 hypothetical protein JZK55_06760 [Dissulfurispira thermophila]
MSDKIKALDAQVRSLEEELKTLKTLIKHIEKRKKGVKTFTSLKGIWKDKVHFTIDEIKDAEIKLKGF